MKSPERVCEYCNCDKEATIQYELINAWLCEEHDELVEDKTGYCSPDCQLGYGCDGSC